MESWRHWLQFTQWGVTNAGEHSGVIRNVRLCYTATITLMTNTLSQWLQDHTWSEQRSGAIKCQHKTEGYQRAFECPIPWCRFLVISDWSLTIWGCHPLMPVMVQYQCSAVWSMQSSPRTLIHLISFLVPIYVQSSRISSFLWQTLPYIPHFAQDTNIYANWRFCHFVNLQTRDLSN